jgi:hypothetical protein
MACIRFEGVRMTDNLARHHATRTVERVVLVGLSLLGDACLLASNPGRNSCIIQCLAVLTYQTAHMAASVLIVWQLARQACAYQGQLLCWLVGALAGQLAPTPSHFAFDWQGVRDGLKTAVCGEEPFS